ncbi:MAG: phage tail protein [Methanosarcina sp.]|jgi:phage tail-like protein
MTNISSYIDYLPSALWSEENNPSQFLGRMLCVFEKILTGISDENSIVHETYEHDNLKKIHEHDNFEKVIDELNQIFDPWKTNKDFLPWLASWVALTLQDDWSEYQKRKLISEMVSIYQERGLKKGLHTYLDIYAATKARPRIAVDDGDAIFRATFLDNGTAVLHTVAHCIAISDKEGNEENLVMTALLHPSAISVDNNNNYIVADQGNAALSPPQQPSLWKVSSTGEIEYKSIPNTPMPMPHSIHLGNPLVNPTAVVVDKQNRYSVVDIGKITSDTSINSAIYRFDPDISTFISNPAVHPVDMILDEFENFVILDRGSHPLGNPPSGSANPKIVVVREGPPIEVTEHSLNSPDEQNGAKVIEPTALVMDSERRFIVADAKNQSTDESTPTPIPADLVRFDPNNGGQKASLLSRVKDNPLIFPISLAFENSQSLLICDSGIRWGFEGDDETNRTMAEPAAIYRIDLSQTPPAISRVTFERKLVNPTKIMIDRKGKLIIVDRGESNQNPPREWRAKANEFGISVFFSQQRLTSNDDRNRIRRGIENVVNEQKPGHTSWWLRF